MPPRPLHLRHPDAVRPWQHVLEPLAGYLKLAEGLLADARDFGGAWNFGPAGLHGQPVRNVASLLFAHARADGAALPEISFGDGSGVHEAGVLLLDSSKAAKELGWQGRLTLSEALRLTWQWHQAHRAGQDLQALTLQQIDSYSQSE